MCEAQPGHVRKGSITRRNHRRGSIALLLAAGVILLLPGVVAAQTFQNATPITILDAQAGMTPRAASPFPSIISVPSGNGTVSSVQVTVSGFSHTNPDDVDAVLRGPGAEHRVIFFSDAGGSADVVSQTLTFDEACPTTPPDEGQLSGGSFATSNYGEADDGFGSTGADADPPYEPLSSFAGTDINTNGSNWSLYVIDDTDNSQAGSISGGWSITFNAASSCAEDGGSGDPASDVQPPDTQITKRPRDKTKKKTATFSFTGSDARAVSGFQCSVDGGTFTPCSSPHTVKVKKGKHTFQVRAIDQAGNVGAPAGDSWKRKKRKK
jgi:hypothetical protein